MKPATQNIEIYKGDDFSIFFRIREKLANGDPGSYVDLTGAVGKAQIRQTEDTATVAAEFTVTIGDQVATPGSVLCTLTGAVTGALSITSPAKWDVQLTHADGKVRTYLAGSVTLIKEVTRV